MLLLPSGSGSVAAAGGLSRDTENPRAENPHVGEFVDVRDRDVERVSASHRKSRDGPMLPVSQYTIVRLGVGHDVVDEILDEVIIEIERPRSASRRRREIERACVAGRHHDHHRLGFLVGNQIVDDEARAAHRRPRVIRVPSAVQQIKDGVLLRAGFIAGRCVHVHAPEFVQAFRIISHAGNGAMRHVLGLHKIGAGNVHHAPGVPV